MNVNNCVSDFQYIGSSLKQLNVNNDFIYLSEQEWEDSIPNIDVKYSIEEVARNDEDENMFGVINLYLSIEIEVNNRSIDVSLTLQGCFTSKNPNEEEFKSLLALNGCTALYSIARSIIISTLSQCFSGHQIILPMINVFKLLEEDEL